MENFSFYALKHFYEALYLVVYYIRNSFEQTDYKIYALSQDLKLHFFAVNISVAHCKKFHM